MGLLRVRYLHVDNPFEVGKDVANIAVSNYGRIRQELRRAELLLGQGASFFDMCQSGGYYDDRR